MISEESLWFNLCQRYYSSMVILAKHSLNSFIFVYDCLFWFSLLFRRMFVVFVCVYECPIGALCMLYVLLDSGL